MLTDETFNAYLETVFWVEEFDRQDLGVKDIDPNHLELLKKMVNQFLEENKDDVEALLELGSEWPKASSLNLIVHDFHLTSQGHGVGFWDGDYPEPQASRLTEASKKYEFVCFYVGDDGKIYVSFPLKLGKELGVPEYADIE